MRTSTLFLRTRPARSGSVNALPRLLARVRAARAAWRRARSARRRRDLEWLLANFDERDWPPRRPPPRMDGERPRPWIM